MKKFTYIPTLVLAFYIAGGQSNLSAANTSSVGATLSTQETLQKGQIDQQLQNEISKQKEDLLRLEKQLADKNQNFEGALKEEFVGKMNSLEVKQILYKKFQGTDSLNNSNIRTKLLELFQKPIISEKDITELQTVIDQQKAKEHH